MLVLVSVCLLALRSVVADFDAKAANKTLHLAWSAYCSEATVKDWSCQWCGEAPKVELLQYVHKGLAGTQGYVGYDTENKRLVVAYRGSVNLANDLEDAAFWKEHMEGAPLGHDIRVDARFQHAWKTVKNQTQTGLALGLKTCPSCRVLITGHSLGSAMATLAAVELAGSQYAPNGVDLYTFGSPRVGNEHFVTYAMQKLKDNKGTSIRMARERDIVPSIPPEIIGYRHLPQEVWDRHARKHPEWNSDDWFVVCDANNGEDKHCHDSEINLSGAEHTLYLGFKGGYCNN